MNLTNDELLQVSNILLSYQSYLITLLTTTHDDVKKQIRTEINDITSLNDKILYDVK